MNSLNNYYIFYEVARTKNITRASENLFISQPAVSQSIKKLEEELSATLFIRDKKGVRLTKFGEEIFQKVETAMLALKSIDGMAIQERELMRGSIVIGSGSNVARELLALPIKNFLENFPNIQITQIEDVQTKMLNMLKKGEVDLVISQQNEQIKELTFTPLLEHKYVFIKKKGVEIKRFIKITKGSYTYELFEGFEKQNGIENHPDIIVSGYRMAIELAKQGIGLALVPEFLVSELIQSGEVEVVFKDYQMPTVTFGYYVNPVAITSAVEVFTKFLER